MPEIDARTAELLQLAKETHWRKALETLVKPQQPLRYERLVYNAAADWLYLLPLTSDAVVLDAGCGWGVLSFQLAQQYKKVVALDESSAAVEFMKIRAYQDKIDNIEPVQGNVLKLPHSDGFFDLVVLNGVLEWVGASDLSKDPLLVQQDFLKEIFRVLKPQGYVYVGIENRWSALYFLGQEEGHVHLKFISLLPRVLGKLYHRVVKKAPYRAYTHSLRMYHKLFVQAGFSSIDTYASIPQYQKFSHLISLETNEPLRYYVQKEISHKKQLAVILAKIIRCLRLYGIVRYFVPSYSFIAAKQRIMSDFERAAQTRESTKAGIKYFQRAYCILYSGIENVVITVFKRMQKQPVIVVKERRLPDAAVYERKKEIIACLKNVNNQPNLLRGTIVDFFDYTYSVRRQTLWMNPSRGVLLKNTIAHKGQFLWYKKIIRDLTMVGDWLIEFQKNTRTAEVCLDGDILRGYINSLYDVCNCQTAYDKEMLISKIRILEDSVRGKKLRLACQHRDFCPNNIFVKDNKIIVIDWGLAQRSGDVLYDVFYFLQTYFFFVFYGTTKDSIANYDAINNYKRDIYFSKDFYIYSVIGGFLRKYCKAMNIDCAVVKLMFLVYEAGKFKNPAMINYFFKHEQDFITEKMDKMLDV